jgi:hypothetical protein
VPESKRLPSLVCASVKDKPAGAFIPKSVQIAKCSGCGEEIFVSESSRNIVAAGEATAICAGCIPTDVPLMLTMTAEQRKELSEFDRLAAQRN